MLLGANATAQFTFGIVPMAAQPGAFAVAVAGGPEFAPLNFTGVSAAVDMTDTTITFNFVANQTFDPNTILVFTFTGLSGPFGAIASVTGGAGGGVGGIQAADVTVVGGAVRVDMSGWTYSAVTTALVITLGVAAAAPPADQTPGGGPPPPPPPNYYPEVKTDFDFLLRYQTHGRLPPLPETVTTPDGRVLPNPLIAAEKLVRGLANQVNAGTLSLQKALDQFVDMADDTTSVAVMTYGFFTGKIPTREGLDYLVSSPVNDRDLNDGFYAGMSLENRYINFAVNLGKVGEGRAAFQAGYGSLSLTDATAKAYLEIFGTTPSTQKLADILTSERVSYLNTMGGDALEAKAAMVGFLLGEAAKSDLGRYSVMSENFLYDLSDGVAGYGSPLIDYWNAGPRYNGLVGEVVG